MAGPGQLGSKGSTPFSPAKQENVVNERIRDVTAIPLASVPLAKEKVCGRAACRAVERQPGAFLWNVETGAWYCKACSERINQAGKAFGRQLCFPADQIPADAHYIP
jgi:hypothetical protein